MGDGMAVHAAQDRYGPKRLADGKCEMLGAPGVCRPLFAFDHRALDVAAAWLEIGLQTDALRDLVVEGTVHHECTAALFDGYDTLSLKMLERLPYSVPVYTELICKCHHGRNLVVWRIGAPVYGFFNSISDFAPSGASHVAVRERVGHGSISRGESELIVRLIPYQKPAARHNSVIRRK